MLLPGAKGVLRAVQTRSVSTQPDVTLGQDVVARRNPEHSARLRGRGATFRAHSDSSKRRRPAPTNEADPEIVAASHAAAVAGTSGLIAGSMLPSCACVLR